MVLVDGLIALDADEIVVGAQVPVEIGRRHLDLRVLREAAGGGFHDGERLREDLVEAFLDRLVLFLDQFVALGGEFFLLLDRNIFLEFLLDLGDPFLERFLYREDLLAERVGMGAELIVGQFINSGISSQDLVQIRTDLLHIAIGLRAENFLQNAGNCHFFLSFSCFWCSIAGYQQSYQPCDRQIGIITYKYTDIPV